MEKVLPGGIYKDLLLEGETEDVAFEVPANRVVELLYGEYKVSTAAPEGDRLLRCRVLANDYSKLLTLFEFTLAASLSKTIDFGISQIINTMVDDVIQLPSRFLLTAGMSLRFYIMNGQVGDTFSFSGKYVEW
ncbi:unnamed protein product, partial [marine sediment metagenome]